MCLLRVQLMADIGAGLPGCPGFKPGKRCFEPGPQVASQDPQRAYLLQDAAEGWIRRKSSSTAAGKAQSTNIELLEMQSFGWAASASIWSPETRHICTHTAEPPNKVHQLQLIQRIAVFRSTWLKSMFIPYAVLGWSPCRPGSGEGNDPLSTGEVSLRAPLCTSTSRRVFAQALTLCPGHDWPRRAGRALFRGPSWARLMSTDDAFGLSIAVACW
jgi:hypothetical protein